MVKESLSKEVAFILRPKRQGDNHERGFQVEGCTWAKALRQGRAIITEENGMRRNWRGQKGSNHAVAAGCVYQLANAA